jgi:hypothetical protein
MPNVNWTLQIATTARFSQWVAPAQLALTVLLAFAGTNSTWVCLVATALMDVERKEAVGIQPISVWVTLAIASAPRNVRQGVLVVAVTPTNVTI